MALTEYTPVRHLKIDEEHVGRRIDNYLSTQLKAVPTARLYSMLRRGEVRVGGKRVKPSYRLMAHDVLRLPPIYSSEKQKSQFVQKLPDNIVLHEDDNYLVANKPSGIAVHGGSGLAFGLVESMRAARNDIDYMELAHRLDKDTSGCLLLVKRRSVLRALHTMFRENKVEKRYRALVCGHPDKQSMLISAPLRVRDRSAGDDGPKTIVASRPGGKESSTKIRLLASARIDGIAVSLVEAIPYTGRMHQIRVHLAHAGYPVAGDQQYGTREDNAALRKVGLKRLFLHAAQLTIPAQEPIDGNSWTAPLPKELSLFLSQHGITDKS